MPFSTDEFIKKGNENPFESHGTLERRPANG